MTILGFYLGRIAFIREHIDAMLVLIVLVSLIPMAVEVVLARRRRGRESAPATLA